MGARLLHPFTGLAAASVSAMIYLAPARRGPGLSPTGPRLVPQAVPEAPVPADSPDGASSAPELATVCLCPLPSPR
jgi:hypothetical protein